MTAEHATALVPVDPRPRLSLVVPAYNEVDSVEALHAELVEVLDGAGLDWECIFVDDGSHDGTADRLRAIREADPRVQLIQFARNAGKSAAYSAGFEAASGALVVTLDADLQDDPHEIPTMVRRLAEGFDLIVGWKRGRLENEPLKTIPSRVFNKLIALTFGLELHDSNCGFRVMRREVATSLDLYGDLYRFIPELAHVHGFRVTEQPVNHRKRKHGASKYGAKRFWTGLLDLLTVRFITRYAQRPLHFFGTLGLAPFLLGLSIELYALGAKLIAGHTFQQHVAAIVIGVMLVIMGFQCIITGLIGEMLSAQQRQRRALLHRDGEQA